MTASAAIGIIAGMEAELDALGALRADPRIITGISGARPERAEVEALRLAGAGVRALVSWGVAGGLDPTLRSGHLVAAREVRDERGGCWALHATEPEGSSSASLLGVERMILSAEEKGALRESSGAAALDMETHRVAKVAAERGLTCVAIRAIGDTAGRSLPRAVIGAIGEDGRPRILPVLMGLLRRPADLPALLALKRETDIALDRLRGDGLRLLGRLLDQDQP